jgi:hypothetical protein
MRLNRTGIGLIAFFLLAGLALVVVPTAVAGLSEAAGILASLGASWMIVALGLGVYAYRQKGRAEHQDLVFRTGVKGTATILAAPASRMEVNEMPVMRLELELDIPGQGRRRVRKSETMPVFVATRMREGLVLPIYANPADPDDIVLVW